MLFDFRILFRRQLGAFKQDFISRANLSYVVEKTGNMKPADIFLVFPQRFGKQSGVISNPV